MAHRLKVAGIVVFLLVDVVLVVYLMGQMRADRYQGGGVDLDQLSTSPSPEQADPVGSVSLIQGKGALMRVTAGSCSKEGRPQLEVSTDGGESFDEMAVPVLAGSEELRPPTVRTIMTATAKSPEELSVVAGDDDCKPAQYDTSDGGASWEKADKVGIWYLSDAGDEVLTPDGAVDPGCDANSLSYLGDGDARVTCEGSFIRATADGGKTWTVLGSLDGVRAAVFPDPRLGFAVAPSGECSSASFSSSDGGLTWQEQACIEEKDKFGVLTGNGGRLVTGDADTVLVSEDRGEKWSKP